MPQSFGPLSSIKWKLLLIFTVTGILVIAVGSETLKYSSYIVKEGVPIDQPVPFSHKHHAGELGIDCRYCHATVEKASFAGMPPTHTCMTCHSQLYTQSKMLEPVRQSYRNHTPIQWMRVTRLPNYVYFDHSVHVNSGVSCETCHGQVTEMPITWRKRSFYMEDCLSCHRNPGPQLRPKDQVVNMNWLAPPHHAEREALAEQLLKKYKIKNPRNLVDCYVCHR